MKILVFGAGIFGCCIAYRLSKAGYTVDLYEKNEDVMLGATANNHNRLHTGAHHPRSPQTINQIQKSVNKFEERYSECVVNDVDSYYGVAAEKSKISADQFETNLVGIVPNLKRLLDFSDLPFKRDKVNSVFSVSENIYDVNVLRKLIKRQLKNSSVNVHYNQKRNVKTFSDTLGSDLHIDCTYGSKYQNSDQSIVGYKTELVHIPVVEMSLPKIACTIMDGNFVSFLPNGNNKNQFLLYDVINSPISMNLDEKIKKIQSRFRIFFDLPEMRHVHTKSAFRITSVEDDARRTSNIIFRERSAEVISGKVTSITSIEDEIFNWVNSLNEKKIGADTDNLRRGYDGNM